MHIDPTTPDDAVYIPARATCARYHGISLMTLHRWLNDPKIGFPKPVYLGSQRFFRIDELEAWERNRPRGLTRATAVAECEGAA